MKNRQFCLYKIEKCWFITNIYDFTEKQIKFYGYLPVLREALVKVYSEEDKHVFISLRIWILTFSQ